MLTTKLPGRHHGYEENLASFEEHRDRLGLDYVDWAEIRMCTRNSEIC